MHMCVLVPFHSRSTRTHVTLALEPFLGVQNGLSSRTILHLPSFFTSLCITHENAGITILFRQSLFIVSPFYHRPASEKTASYNGIVSLSTGRNDGRHTRFLRYAIIDGSRIGCIDQRHALHCIYDQFTLLCARSGIISVTCCIHVQSHEQKAIFAICNQATRYSVSVKAPCALDPLPQQAVG